MTTAERRANAESRLRRAFASLSSARALLAHDPPLRDDAVNRASAAALNAARSLVAAQWAKISSSGWDPTWRPGMSKPADARIDQFSRHAYDKLLDRFTQLAEGAGLPHDFVLYLRTLVDDGFEADVGETPAYDSEESDSAIDTAQRLVQAVAGQLGMADEFKELSRGWPPLDPSADTTDEGAPLRLVRNEPEVAPAAPAGAKVPRSS